MLPAAAMGLDVASFLARTAVMVHSCASCVPPEQNPGVRLGLILGTLAVEGRDKLTLVTSPELASLGGWIEQLVAESTGKQGLGIVPVDGEALASPQAYGSDRLFVQLKLADSDSSDQDAALAALEAAGHPVVRIEIANALDLGQDFFRWEMATAVAGAVLGINPFDQPDVEAAKLAAQGLMKRFEDEGSLPSPSPIVSESGLTLYADDANTKALSGDAAADVLSAHLARLQPGDYFAINAYVEMNDANQAELQALRQAVRDHKRVATTLGFGPRFLHSTGQLHKGGPDTGVFLQITSDSDELAIPGQAYPFNTLEAAQAQGDFEVLCERGRRALRVHVGRDVAAGLAKLRGLCEAALSS